MATWRINKKLGDVPTTSLIAHLDAGDSSSYPGTGTTWYDISSQADTNDFSLTGSPTYESTTFGGYFEFNGTTQYANNITQVSDGTYLDRRTAATSIVSIQRYTPGSTIRGRILSNDNGSSVNWLQGEWADTNERFYAGGWVTASSNGGSDTNWRIYVTLNDDPGDSWALYSNNSLIASNANGSVGPRDLAIGRWGQPGSEYSECQFAVLLVYDRIITTDEISDIYLFYKDRFGIA